MILRDAAPVRLPYCRHLGKSHLVRTRIANGSWQVRRLCEGCGQPFGTALAKAVGWDKLPVFDGGYRNPPCMVHGCTEAFTEYHHWLPRAFAEAAGLAADEWPGGYLCRQHHMQWHRLVTPGLVPEADKVRSRS